MEFASPAIRFKEEEKTYNEDKIDALNNVMLEYDANVILVAIRVYNSSNITNLKTAKIVVDRVIKVDNVELVERLVDGYDSELIVRDTQSFKHKYRINIVGDSIRVIGIVRWY